jgi:sugar lactone lactonase YvrE
MRTLAVVLAALLLALLAGVGAATNDVRRIVAFDPAAGQLPEGLAADRAGNLFMSLSPLGQVLKLEPGATAPELFGSVSGIDAAAGDLGMAGLAVDRRGDVYAAVNAKAAQGVWRFDRKTGAATRLPGTEKIPFPNGLAFDRRGALYVASSSEGPSAGGVLQGGIWRVSRKGSVERILVDEVLGGLGQLIPGGIGANGIAHRDGVLYVTNSEKATLLRIRVRPGGSLGAPKVIASDPRLAGADGLALDVRGNVYVAVITQSSIVRVGRKGVISHIADASDGLDWASSLAFGTRKRDRRTLYAVNFALGTQFGNPPGAGPALLAIQIGVPGQLLP